MEDTDGLKEMMRMDFEHFREIFNLIEPDITRQETVGGNKNYFGCRTFEKSI